MPWNSLIPFSQAIPPGLTITNMRALPIRINMYIQPVLHPIARNHSVRRDNPMFLRQLLLHLRPHQLRAPSQDGHTTHTSGVRVLPFSLDSHSCVLAAAGLSILCDDGLWFMWVWCLMFGGVGQLGEDRVVLFSCQQPVRVYSCRMRNCIMTVSYGLIPLPRKLPLRHSLLHRDNVI
jgi:hypothetical protein